MGHGGFAPSSSRAGREALFGEQAMAHGVQAGRGPAVGTDLAVDVLDVVAGCLGGDDERSGDLLVREAQGEELEDLDLPGGEARGTFLAAGDPVAGGDEDGVDGVAVEVAGTYRCPQRIGGIVRGVRRAV